jgi:DNA (cytosine-5)-methyltransferase 1
MRPLLLDLFCGAGGAGMGYHRAGFDIVGVDIKPQPRYPFEFHQGDALEYLEQHGHKYDVIHASPPCQAFSVITPAENRKNHPDLIIPTRNYLSKIGKPFVIENVPGAKNFLINPIMLCGSMFKLKVWRHRYFEIVPQFYALLPCCNHSFAPVLLTGRPGRKGKREKEPCVQERRDAADLQWMNREGMDQAIPPAYTEWIGKRILEEIQHEKSSQSLN